jgi:hypothetical protein
MASNVRFVDSLKVGQYKGSAGTPGTDFSGSFTGSFTGSGEGDFTGSFTGSFEGSGDLTGSFTGSFTGDGSGLTNLPISDPFPFTGSAQITGSLGVTGSINATNFTGSSFTGSFVGDGSGLTTLKATETDLQQSITSNQTVGGVSSGEVFNPGTDVEDILRQILISYIEPTISNLDIKNNNVEISYIRDVGDDFITDEVTFNATQDNPNGNFPKNSELVITNATSGNGTITGPTTLVSSNSITITDRTISKTTDGTVTFRVNTESQTTSDTQTTTKLINFRWRNYLLATSIVIDNNTKLETAFSNNTVQSPLDIDISWDATCNSDNENTNNFTYIVYPSSYGDLTSIIQSGATPVLGAFTKLTDITANNSSGISQTWRIYKSNIPGAFASGVILTIS